MKSVKALVLGGALLLWATAVGAVDSVSLEIGSTFQSPETTLWRVGAQWDWNKKWFESDGWFLGGYWDASLGRWHSADNGGNHDVTDFGVTPVFRYQKAGQAPTSKRQSAFTTSPTPTSPSNASSAPIFSSATTWARVSVSAKTANTILVTASSTFPIAASTIPTPASTSTRSGSNTTSNRKDLPPIQLRNLLARETAER